MSATTTRLPQVPAEQVTDERLLAVLDRAAQLSTPKPAWYLTLAHSPEIANAYADYWDVTHRGGQVQHTTKELMRIAIAQLLGCEFSADDLGLGSFPLPSFLGIDVRMHRPLIAADTVRFVGEVVAVVVAESREIGVDAAELVQV